MSSPVPYSSLYLYACVLMALLWSITPSSMTRLPAITEYMICTLSADEPTCTYTGRPSLSNEVAVWYNQLSVFTQGRESDITNTINFLSSVSFSQTASNRCSPDASMAAFSLRGVV